VIGLRQLHHVTVELKVLTPMFTYGEKNNCEFRLTELKSLMRTIFREFFEFESLADMREKEGKIFGSLGGKAPVSFKMINIKDKNNKNIKPVVIKHPLLPHKKEKNDQSNINSIEINEIISFKMISWDKEMLDLHCQLLLLSSLFGSVGKRARKGLGSFRIIDIKSLENTCIYNYLNKKPSEILSILEYLKYLNLRKFEKKTYKIKITENNSKNEILYTKIFPIENNNFYSDYPRYNEIRIIKINNIDFSEFRNTELKSKESIFLNTIKKSDKTFDRLLFRISQLTHHRLGNEFKKSILKADNKTKLNQNEIDKINNHILGQHKNTGKGYVERYASPVWISFWENEDSKYMIIKVLNFNCSPIRINDEDKLYINSFVQDLTKIGGGTWQSYSQSQ
jgi:CRISPR-associated protein Cmr1